MSNSHQSDNRCGDSAAPNPKYALLLPQSKVDDTPYPFDKNSKKNRWIQKTLSWQSLKPEVRGDMNSCTHKTPSGSGKCSHGSRQIGPGVSLCLVRPKIRGVKVLQR